jgi:hypothetical protein
MTIVASFFDRPCDLERPAYRDALLRFQVRSRFTRLEFGVSGP